MKQFTDSELTTIYEACYLAIQHEGSFGKIPSKSIESIQNLQNKVTLMLSSERQNSYDQADELVKSEVTSNFN